MDKSQVRSCISGSGSITYDPTTGVIGGGGGGGGTSWELLGNGGTDPAINFAGTTDAEDYVIRTNNVERLRVFSGGRISINTSSTFTYLNVSGGTYLSGNNGTSHLLEIIGANDNLVNVDGTGVVIGATDSTNYSEIYAQADGLLHFGSNKPMEFVGQVKIVDGTQGAGKLFISDANGVGSWQSSGQVNLTTGVTGILPISNGGTGGSVYAGEDLLDTQVASSSSVIDLLLTGTYTRYIVRVSNLVTATNSTILGLRVGTGGTPTYQSGASDYCWTRVFASAVGAQGGAANTDTKILIGSNGGQSNSATRGYSSDIIIVRPSQTSDYHTLYYQGFLTDSSGVYYYQAGGGLYLSTTAVTAVRIFLNSGNIASGTFKLYGIR